MKPTITEIARIAGVAKSTVSKALNGQNGVSDEKRNEILELVRRMQYEPNASAQALASNRSGAIGLLIPLEYGGSLSGSFWASIITTIASVVKTRNYALNILIPDAENNVLGTIESVVRRRNVDGLIIGAERMTPTIANLLDREHIPFVLIGRNTTVNHHAVDADNAQGSEEVVSRLIESGYRHIACLGGPEGYHYSHERIQGYHRALDRHDIPWRAVSNAVYADNEVRLALKELITKHPDIDALFVTSGGDFLLDSIDILSRHNYSLSNFGFGSFDDYRFFDYLGIDIWSVRQPLEDLGRESALMLLSLLNGTPPADLYQTCPVTLIHHQGLRQSNGDFMHENANLTG